MDTVLQWILANKAFLGMLFSAVSAALAAAGYTTASHIVTAVAGVLWGGGALASDTEVRAKQAAQCAPCNPPV